MEELIGIAEIADLFQVSSAAVINWRKRFEDFPQPIVTLKAGPVFSAEQIKLWERRRKNMDTKSIAMINLKGGVAKTTTTVGLAHILAGDYKKKVLVIDLDPQTNATTMLIGEKKWLELNKDGHTLAALFSDAVNGESKFDLSKALQRSVGDVAEAQTIDLLPSSLDLIDLQDRLTQMPAGQFGMRNPVTILLRGLSSICTDYDYILIDCPPNLGYITLNGLRISDGYIIPTIPDVLSTYGIPQIVTRISKFSNEIAAETKKRIVPVGIVATKVRSTTSLHRTTLANMKRMTGADVGGGIQYPRVFESFFPERTQIAEAADFLDAPRTLRQKWGYTGQYDAFKAFTDEFIQVCGEI